MKRLNIILFISFIFLITISFVLISKNVKSWEIRFKKVLNDIKQNSINNHDWKADNWNQYFEKQLNQLPIYNKASFYKSVQNALKDLNDNHSFLVNTHLKQNKYQKNVSQNIKEDYSIIIDHEIGIIYMPPVYCDVSNENKNETFLNEEWVKSFHEALKNNKQKVTKGWIIDLTKNSGGNMYPVIAALSYFYNKTSIGGFYSFGPEGEKVKTFLTFNGQSFLFNSEIGLQYETQFPINQNKLPVVVLIDHATASSAEFLTLVLKRQDNVILMGQPTFGIATGNEVMSLPDNLGHYMLTVCYYLDNNDQPLLAKKIIPQIILKNNAKMIEQAKNFIKDKY